MFAMGVGSATVLYPKCFYWVDSYKIPPRRGVAQDCNRVSNKEVGISMNMSPLTFTERVKGNLHSYGKLTLNGLKIMPKFQI